MRSEALVDRNGRAWATVVWSGDRVARVEVPGATIHCEEVSDPLLGAAHPIAGVDGELTRISAIDWARPTEIPAIAAPGRLPSAAGGAIMNVLAILAQRAGVTALRYAGPYPTSLLWKTLLRSFSTAGTEAEFSADLPGRMLRVARDPIPIDFVPAPHERLAIAGGHVELRGRPDPWAAARGETAVWVRIERAVINGIAYEIDGSPARIVDVHQRVTIGPPRDYAAELWFGDQRYGQIARFYGNGTLSAGPFAPPVCTSDVIGKRFPPMLIAALAALISDVVPPPIAAQAAAWLTPRTIAWADLGARAARRDGDTIEIHAAIWQLVGPPAGGDLARLALAIVEAIAPLVTSAIVAESTRPSSFP